MHPGLRIIDGKYPEKTAMGHYEQRFPHGHTEELPGIAGRSPQSRRWTRNQFKRASTLAWLEELCL